MAEKKKRFSVPWTVWRAVFVTVGVILILALVLHLLGFVLDFLLGMMFPEQVREVPIGYVNREVGVDLSSGTVLENWDDHGGFLGDGETLVRISFSEEDGAQVEEALENTSGYITGKFTPSTAALLDHWSDIAFPDTEQILWKLKDRNPDSGGASVNITVIVYDRSTRILYYYEHDT